MAATAAYDAIAEWYDRSIRDGALLATYDLLGSDLFAGAGSLDGRIVCDLACGQGEMARRLAAGGAKVAGVDLSGRLLEIARREEDAEPRGIVYLQDDAQSLTLLTDASFDGVLCNMALMDIPDLDAVFRAVRRILKPGGWFVFTITHPCFQAPPEGGYFAEGFWRSNNPRGVRGQVGAYHRTLASYLNALAGAGLFVECLHEPRQPDRDVPAMLVALCRILPERTHP